MTIEVFRHASLFFRDLKVTLRLICKPLITLLTTLFGGAFLLRHYQPEASLTYAVYEVLRLATFSPSNPLPQEPMLIGLYFAMPLFGIASGIGLIEDMSVALFAKKKRSQDWEIELAHECNEHIIVCGVGKVGFEVIKFLVSRGQQLNIVAVEHDSVEPHIDEIRGMEIPVIIGDMQRPKTLKEAGIDRASVLILAAEDDALHMKTMLKVSELIPDTQKLSIIFRIFDTRLASIANTRSIANVHRNVTLIPIDVSRAIAESVREQLLERSISMNSSFTIIGLGKVGFAILRMLLESDVPKQRVTIIDKDLHTNPFHKTDLTKNVTWLERDILDICDDLANLPSDVVIVSTGDDSMNLAFAYNTQLSRKPIVIRTRYRDHQPSIETQNYIPVNTTTVAVKMIGCQIDQILNA